MKKLIATLCLSSGLLFLTLPLSAQPPAGADAMDSGQDFRHLEFIADQLGLSESQEEQINAIIGASELASAVDRERARQINDEIKAQVDSFDAGTVQILADELGTIVARLTYSRAETRVAIHQVFTVEQQAQLAELKQQRPERSRNPEGRPGRGYSGEGA